MADKRVSGKKDGKDGRTSGWLQAAAGAWALFWMGGAHALSVTPTTDASTLVGTIAGSGITIVGTPSFTGAMGQAGTFTGGGATVGFGSGIVLSSGDVTAIPGPNATGSTVPETLGLGDISDDDLSIDYAGAGDPDLDALTGGFTTNDAAVLTFDFQFGDGSTGGDLYFNFVFASEEYVDFVGSIYNDVFGFFVDGVNIALVPGSGDPISVNTINPNTNAAYYVNNVPNTDGFPVAGLDIKFDGLTTVMQATVLGLGPGLHTMKIAVADTSDNILDAAVFIQAGTFGDTPTPVPAPVPLALFAAGLAASGLAGRVARTRRGDD